MIKAAPWLSKGSCVLLSTLVTTLVPERCGCATTSTRSAANGMRTRKSSFKIHSRHAWCCVLNAHRTRWRVRDVRSFRAVRTRRGIRDTRTRRIGRGSRGRGDGRGRARARVHEGARSRPLATRSAARVLQRRSVLLLVTCPAGVEMASDSPLTANMEEDGFYMAGLSATRQTTDNDEDPAAGGVTREILAAMPGAMQTSGSSSDPSPMRRNRRFKPLTEDERKAARAQAADERREEAIRIKRRLAEVKRQAQARYAPPVDAPCIFMTLVLLVLIGLWVADIWHEYLLEQRSSAATRAEAPAGFPAVQHEDV